VAETSMALIDGRSEAYKMERSNDCCHGVNWKAVVHT
jgi:hypothetical protein